MSNVFNWLPFDTDENTGQRSKKWLTNSKGTYQYTDGELLDPTNFIPRTSKAVECAKGIKNINSLDALERWFLLNELVKGNRNCGLLKYAMLQYDAGKDYETVEAAVKSLNQKLGDDKLKADELRNTVLKTLSSKY